jgi:hypothetical protein
VTSIFPAICSSITVSLLREQALVQCDEEARRVQRGDHRHVQRGLLQPRIGGRVRSGERGEAAAAREGGEQRQREDRDENAQARVAHG